MKSATAKELRNSAAAIIETVRKGHEIVITKRGKAVAVLKPILEKPEKEFTPVGFGLWEGRKDLKDVAGWVSKKREERFQK